MEVQPNFSQIESLLPSTPAAREGVAGLALGQLTFEDTPLLSPAFPGAVVPLWWVIDLRLHIYGWVEDMGVMTFSSDGCL